MALCHATRHIAWLKDLLTELDLEEMVPGPVELLGDNRAANLLSEEDIVTCGNQFIQLPYHYTKQEVKAGHIIVLSVSSTDNLADLLTKATSGQVCAKLIPALTGYDHYLIIEIIERTRARDKRMTSAKTASA